MSTFTALKNAFQLSDMVLTRYIEDFDDAELMNRPGTGCNHIAWQLGHLISSEANLINMVKPDSAMDLPEGFAESHAKEKAGNDDPAAFASKATYVELYQKTRENSLKVLEGLSEEEYRAEAPEHFRSFCPDMTGVAMLIATHPMMHVGQFVPVRRALDKPIAI